MNPTLRLLAAVVLVFACTLAWALLQPEPVVLAAVLLVNTLLGILVFTPLHEACHGVASRDRRVNAAVMALCWPFFLHSPYLFRAIHMQHHAHTGDDANDPDAFCKRRTLAGSWLASFLLVAHYYYRYLNDVRSWRRVAHAAVSLAVPVGMTVFVFTSDHGPAIAAAWLVPNVLAIGILAYVDTALPHGGLPATSRVTATRIIEMPRLAELTLGAQNLHLVHHLKPTLPWYRYREYWLQNEGRLRALGAVVDDYRRPARRLRANTSASGAQAPSSSSQAGEA